MPAKKPMSVVLLWHMHQPEYRNLRTGAVHLPWTYLHAIKDYVDMAAHLEAMPKARAVVNFAPILLEQFEDYIGQITAYLKGDGTIRDPVLAGLAEPATGASAPGGRACTSWRMPSAIAPDWPGVASVPCASSRPRESVNMQV